MIRFWIPDHPGKTVFILHPGPTIEFVSRSSRLLKN